jgi:NhaP-type Na+/H+ or K+/H+ antiporter
MLLSIALIIIISLMLAKIMNLLKIPSMIGMLLAGILLGPYVLNLIADPILEVSSELRQMALIVILLRAGLALKLEDFKKMGKPALLMAFVPATIELIGVIILGPLLFPISFLEAALLGSILAAVSPAVVVPRMIRLMESGYGKKKHIPQLILSGASLDDVYVIILFTSFLQAILHGEFSMMMLVQVPSAILLGIGLGLGMGYLSVYFFKRFHMRDTVKVLILFSISFLFLVLEESIKPTVFLSGLLAVMTCGGMIHHRYSVLAKRLVSKFEKIWVIAEIILFVMVGAAVNLSVMPSIGLSALLLVIGALLFRMGGVYLALLGSKLHAKEKLFVSLAYLPKATVQAAIGAIPLSMGISSGYMMLAVAVFAIIVTAPLGAILIDWTAPHLLDVEMGQNQSKRSTIEEKSS